MMPDPNAFAERQHSASQARAEERYEEYGLRVIASIVDDLFDGKKVDGLTLHDFCEEALTWEDVGALLIAGGICPRYDALKEKVERHIFQWCEGRGSDEVAERIRSWEETDRAESRHAIGGVDGIRN